MSRVIRVETEQEVQYEVSYSIFMRRFPEARALEGRALQDFIVSKWTTHTDLFDEVSTNVVTPYAYITQQ